MSKKYKEFELRKVTRALQALTEATGGSYGGENYVLVWGSGGFYLLVDREHKAKNTKEIAQVLANAGNNSS